mgnify:FL=1
MSRELELQASGETASVPSRLTVARLLFLAGALNCCAYAVSLGLSQQRLLNSPEVRGAGGAVVVFLALALEHVAWWWVLRNADQFRIGWAKKASYMHVVLFFSATLNNSPRNGHVLLAIVPSVPENLIIAAAPPLLVLISGINAFVLRRISFAKGGVG